MNTIDLILCLSIAFCAVLNGGNAQRTPSISYISQEQIKDIGGTVELECSVQYAQDYSVIWMKVCLFSYVGLLTFETLAKVIFKVQVL